MYVNRFFIKDLKTEIIGAGDTTLHLAQSEYAAENNREKFELQLRRKELQAKMKNV